MTVSIESLLLKILEQTPVAGAIIVVVWMFIKFLKEDRGLQHALLREFHADHLSARAAASLAIEKNAEATLSHGRALQQNTDTLVRLAASVDRCGNFLPPRNNQT